MHQARMKFSPESVIYDNRNSYQRPNNGYPAPKRHTSDRYPMSELHQSNRRRYEDMFQPEALLGETFIDGKVQRPDYKMKFKTELCRNWELNSECKFGAQCAFAHGRHELRRKVHTHDNYKTAPCRGFHERGYCLYGTRCQFIHSAHRPVEKLVSSFSVLLKTSEYVSAEMPVAQDSKLNEKEEGRLPFFKDLTDSSLQADELSTNNSDSECSATSSDKQSYFTVPSPS